MQPEDFTPPDPYIVTLVIDSYKKESVSDKHTFQAGDDIYKDNLPKPDFQYNLSN